MQLANALVFARRGEPSGCTEEAEEEEASSIAFYAGLSWRVGAARSTRADDAEAGAAAPPPSLPAPTRLRRRRVPYTPPPSALSTVRLLYPPPME